MKKPQETKNTLDVYGAQRILVRTSVASTQTTIIVAGSNSWSMTLVAVHVQVHVTWETGDVSVFDAAWLRTHCYSQAAREARASARPQPKEWDEDMRSNLPWV